MRKILLLLLFACDQASMAPPPKPDLSAPHPALDLSGGGTTCDEARRCMQGCSDHFSACASGCAGDLSSVAQPLWDTVVSCFDAHCGASDGGAAICDNWSVMSCVVCANTYCQTELLDCVNH